MTLAVKGLMMMKMFKQGFSNFALCLGYRYVRIINCKFLFRFLFTLV